MKFFLASIFCICSLNLFAAKLLDVTMPNSLTLNGQKIVLNGMGIRKKKILFLRVKVYVGGLYLSEKTTNVSKVLNQAGPKVIKMHFVRSVGRKKLIGGWKEAFSNSLPKKEHSKLESRIHRFYKMMEDIDDTKEIKIIFLKDKVSVVFNGKNKGDILGPDFVKALLSVWFINAGDQNLRDGLLGKKDSK